MMSNSQYPDYYYSERSRRPIMFGVAAIAFLMIVIAYQAHADWYFFIPVVFALAMCLWALILDRLSGMEVSGNSITMFAGKWKNTIDIADIAAVKITRWSDGAPTVVLRLKNGKREMVPGYCIGSSKEFSEALAARAIPVTVN